MIRRFLKSLWDLMIDIGEARQKRIRANTYHMWY